MLNISKYQGTHQIYNIKYDKEFGLIWHSCIIKCINWFADANRGVSLNIQKGID